MVYIECREDCYSPLMYCLHSLAVLPWAGSWLLCACIMCHGVVQHCVSVKLWHGVELWNCSTTFCFSSIIQIYLFKYVKYDKTYIWKTIPTMTIKRFTLVRLVALNVNWFARHCCESKLLDSFETTKATTATDSALHKDIWLLRTQSPSDPNKEASWLHNQSNPKAPYYFFLMFCPEHEACV